MKTFLIASFFTIIFLTLASANESQSRSAQKDSKSIDFVDITSPAGIKWGIKTLAPGTRYLIETMGGGGGFIDYNGDGLLDIYLVCYSQNPQPDGNSILRDVLYRNNGDGTFTDVTESAGISNSMRGMGLAVGDYNNDGWPDIYITGFGASKLYRNNGDGTFTDVSEKAKIANPKGKGLGVVALDYDNDGRMDLFQANDAAANFLYHNDGNGSFSEVALAAGVAFDPDGNARGGMGVDAEDLDGDGYLEIFVANFSDQTNTLFHNDKDGLFTEITNSVGLGAISIPMSGFGSRFFDYNNDGLVDLFVLNGHPFEPINKISPHVTYTEPPFLFENTGKGFREVAAEHGAPLKKFYSGRGLAVGDFDNDGDSDLLLINVGEAPALLRNDGGNRNHWLGIVLTGTTSNRD